MKLVLPNQPIVFSDESRRGLLVRTATGNGWTLSLLARAIHEGESIDIRAYVNIHSNAIVFGEAVLFGHDEMAFLRNGRATQLEGADLMWNGMRVPTADLRRDLVAVCPMCIAEDDTPYLRSSWEHRLTKSCDLHGCKLVERCQACETDLTFLQSISLTHCHCGADIRRFTPEPCEVQDSQFVRASIHNKDHASLSGALDLLDVLSTFYDGQREPPKTSALHNLAVNLYLHPHQIPDTLKGDGPERLSVRTLLIHDVPERSSAQMFRALAACASVGRLHVDGQWGHIFSREVLTSSAHRILGCTRSQIRSFKQSDRLTSSAADSSDSKRISLELVNQLLLDLQAAQHPSGTEALSRKTVRGVGSAIAAWAKGLVDSAGYDLEKGLTSLRLFALAQVAEANAYLALGSMAADDVARLAGVSPGMFRSLRGTNIQLKWTRGRGGGLGVDSGQAAAFVSTYRFGAEIAREVGACAGTFSHKLWSHGVTPVSGPLIDGAISYLFRRSDLAGLDLAKIAAVGGYKSTSGRPRLGDVKRSVPDGWMDVKEAASMLGISRQRFRRFARDSNLCSVRIPGIKAALVSAQKVRELKKESCNTRYSIRLDDAAAEVNETASQFNRRWIMTGVVESTRRHGIWFVSRSGFKEVKRLKAEYEVAADLSARAGLQRTHFVNRSRVESVGLELKRVSRGNSALNLVPKGRARLEMEAVFGPDGWTQKDRAPEPGADPI